MSASSRFLQGFLTLGRGLGLLKRSRGLLIFAVIPFFFGMILMSLGIYWAVMNLATLVQMALAAVALQSGLFFSFAYWIVLLIAWPAFLFALVYLVFLISKVIASPFNALLAERALIALKVIEDQPFHLGRWLHASVRMLIVSIFKALLFGVLGVILFVLSFVPILNIAAAYCFLLIVAFDSVDYSFEALQYPLRRRIGFFLAHLPEFMGLGANLGLVFFVPGLNFFLFPAAVAGGAELMSRIRAYEGREIR